MKRYSPLNPSQRKAIQELGLFFNTRKLGIKQASQEKAVNPPAPDRSKDIPSKFIKATDLLTPQEKEKLEEHGKKIQKGFDKFSAY
jgi:hypothetical protein